MPSTKVKENLVSAQLTRGLFTASGEFHEKGEVVSLPEKDVPSSAKILGDEEKKAEKAEPKSDLDAGQAKPGDTLHSLTKKGD